MPSRVHAVQAHAAALELCFVANVTIFVCRNRFLRTGRNSRASLLSESELAASFAAPIVRPRALACRERSDVVFRVQSIAVDRQLSPMRASRVALLLCGCTVAHGVEQTPRIRGVNLGGWLGSCFCFSSRPLSRARL